MATAHIFLQLQITVIVIVIIFLPIQCFQISYHYEIFRTDGLEFEIQICSSDKGARTQMGLTDFSIFIRYRI